VGHNPSYVWRSIMRARFIVCGGARWSIGTDVVTPRFPKQRIINI